METRPAGHRDPARHDPDTALYKIQKSGGEQTNNQNDQRKMVEKPDEGQLEEIETEPDSEDRVRFGHMDGMSSQQVIFPVTGGPLPHEIADDQNAEPDERAKFDDLRINTVAGMMGDGPRNPKIDTHQNDEANAAIAA